MGSNERIPGYVVRDAVCYASAMDPLHATIVVVREAAIPGGTVKVFDDASIEVQTAAGSNWFRNFIELERSLRAKDGLEPQQEADSTDNGGGHSGDAHADASLSTPTETAPSVGFLGPEKDTEPAGAIVRTPNPVGD